jgi:hypothetical protein
MVITMMDDQLCEAKCVPAAVEADGPASKVSLNTTLILSHIAPSDQIECLVLSRRHQRATHEAHTGSFVVLIL